VLCPEEHLCESADGKETWAHTLSTVESEQNNGLIQISQKHTITIGERSIELTPMEVRVLRVLINRPNEVIPREEIVEEVWGYAGRNSNIVDVYICRIRLKIEVNAKKPPFIIAIRSVGYMFVTK
jgi:DNA-binding response OmpR family regulator